MKKVLVNGALLILSISISVLLLEAGVRIILPWYDPSRQIDFYTNSDGVTLGKPNAVMHQRTPKGDYDLYSRFNQYGLRDTKDLAKSVDGDLFVIGDSFTFGWGIPDGGRYSDRLEVLLNRPVFNVAIPDDIKGYERLLEYARSKGANVSSIIVGICMANDLNDYTHTTVVKEVVKSRRKPWQDFLKRNSAIYLALSYELQKIPSVKKFLEDRGLARSAEELSAIHANVADDAVLNSSRDETLKLLGMVRSGVVLIIPNRGLWAGSNQANESIVHEKFVAMLRLAGVRVVDMRPILEKTGRPLDYYFVTDPHWNDEGHKLAAEALFKYINDTRI